MELVPTVRELYPNGTMYFPPFAVSYYRPDIHDQVYVCIAVNSVGKIRSRDIHVRAGKVIVDCITINRHFLIKFQVFNKNLQRHIVRGEDTNWKYLRVVVK